MFSSFFLTPVRDNKNVILCMLCERQQIRLYILRLDYCRIFDHMLYIDHPSDLSAPIKCHACVDVVKVDDDGVEEVVGLCY